MRRAGKKTIGVGAMHRLKGISGRRSAEGQRLEATAVGMEWDKAARESRATLPYKGSSEDVRNRLGQNLPTAPNGARES